VKRQIVTPGKPPVVYVNGLAPVSLREGVIFFSRELPRHGFRLTGGDAEGWEADTKFAQPGLKGGLKIANIPSCGRTVALLVGVLPTPAR
jgi:hypothetical protein